MKFGNVLCSLALAGSAGLAIGLLFAPDKGSLTRKKIKQKSEDLLEDEIIRYNRIVCDVKTKIDTILNEVSIPMADDNIRNWGNPEQKNKIIV